MAATNPKIPGFSQKMLRLFCPDHLQESIEGDLIEKFDDDVKIYGIRIARYRFTWNVVRFFHPDILLRNSINFSFMNYGLIGNHTKISFRNLIKGKVYSVINIAGLAMGIAACMLILCYTQFEKSFDNFHPEIDQLYRVNQTAIWDKDGGLMSSTAPPLAALLQDHFPEVASTCRLNTPGNALIRYKNNNGIIDAYNEENILAADSNFFEFFQIPLKEGDAREALTGIGKVVITEEISAKYFGTESALGKTLEFGDDRRPLHVTAVTEKLPLNMHISFDFLISMPTNSHVKEFSWSWIWTQMVTYVKLKPHIDFSRLESRLQEIPDRHIQSTFDRLGMDFEDFLGNKGEWKFQLQPVKSIHLESASIGNRIANTTDGSIVNILQVLAFLILIVAMINFVNLATARSSTRNKEIGVKKTLGASPASLVAQFLIESILITAIAMLLAYPLVSVLKYAVFQTTLISIPISIIYEIRSIAILAGGILFIGLISGFYPALYLSGFKIERVFRNNSKQGGGASNLRNGLVIIQFAVSIALIAGTAIIIRQLNFMKHRDLGFNQEHVLVINHAEKLGNQIESFRNELTGLPGIDLASISMEIPGRGTWEDIFMREGSNIKLPIGQIKIDDNFFSTLQFRLLAGRLFDRDRPADNHAVIINETTARLFGWTIEESLGKKIIYPGYPSDIRVLGVVDDFHFQSLRQEINPLMFFNLRSDMWGDMRVVTIKYGDIDPTSLLDQLKSTWIKYAHDAPFDYSFYDEELAMMYQEDAQVGNLIGLFGGFTLFIAIIGLIGMVTYSVERRKKEIGIRKVLGASAFEIFLMFNKQYVLLGLIAMLISIPISWNSLNNWLHTFAFRVDLNPLVFLISGLTVIILAVASVAYLSLSAASIQPSQVLKDD